MKKLSSKEALKAALKADTLSLTSWQLGMYGWVTISFFLIFNRRLEATDSLFWFMMQIAMLLGLITAFPTNWRLIKRRIKEEMLYAKKNSPGGGKFSENPGKYF